MRLGVLCVGHPDTTASTRFRISQFQEVWQAQGWIVNLVPQQAPDALARLAWHDVIINQKCLLSARTFRRLRALAPRLVFDLDDAIWTRPGRDYSWLPRLRVRSRLHRCLRESDCTVFANAFLAGHCRAHVRQGEILPMALDTDRWRPSPAKSPGLRLGWAGAPGNLPFLRRIEPVLGTILTEFPAAQLQVLCGQDPHLSIPYHWLPWRPDHEIPFVQSLDIGLLPLPHEPFACGKSPIKALQYLACGVLVVGDLPAGGSGADDFLRPGASLAVGRDGSWTDCLRRAVTDVASRAAAASRGRAWAVSKHSLPTVAEQWLAVLDPARRPQKLADCEQENAETLEAKIRPNTTDPEGKT